MTGYPEGAEGETRSGIFVPCETPKNEPLPPTALPILPLVLSAPGPRDPPTFPQPPHGKLQPFLAVSAEVPINGYNPLEGMLQKPLSLSLKTRGGLTWCGWQTTAKKCLFADVASGFLSCPFSSSVSCQEQKTEPTGLSFRGPLFKDLMPPLPVLPP